MHGIRWRLSSSAPVPHLECVTVHAVGWRARPQLDGARSQCVLNARLFLVTACAFVRPRCVELRASVQLCVREIVTRVARQLFIPYVH